MWVELIFGLHRDQHNYISYWSPGIGPSCLFVHSLRSTSLSMIKFIKRLIPFITLLLPGQSHSFIFPQHGRDYCTPSIHPRHLPHEWRDLRELTLTFTKSLPPDVSIWSLIYCMQGSWFHFMCFASTNKQTNEQTNKWTSERTENRTNEQANEQKTERTNQRTNEPTNDRLSFVLYVSCLK